MRWKRIFYVAWLSFLVHWSGSIAGASPNEDFRAIQAQLRFLKRVLVASSEYEKIPNDLALTDSLDLALQELKTNIQPNDAIETLTIAQPSDYQRHIEPLIISRFHTLLDEMTLGFSSPPPRVNFEFAEPKLVQRFESSIAAFQKFFHDLGLSGVPSVHLIDQVLSLNPTAKATFALNLIARLKAIASFREVPKLITQSADFQFQNESERRFFQILVETYFSDLDHDHRYNVLKGLIERPDQRSPIDLFRLFVRYADPVLLKFIQQFGRRPGFSQNLQTIFAQAGSENVALPREIVEPLLTETPRGYQWVSVDLDHPFAGTMAQTYKGEIRDLETGEIVQVYPRVTKDATLLRERLKNGRTRLLRLQAALDTDPLVRKGSLPQMGPLVDDVLAMLDLELNSSLLRKHQDLAERSYRGWIESDYGLHVEFKPSRLLGFNKYGIPFFSGVAGQTLRELKATRPIFAAEVMEVIALKWVEEALFYQRFFHGDLHPDNFKIHIQNAEHVTVGIFDNGIAGVVDKQMLTRFVRLATIMEGLPADQSPVAALWDLVDHRLNRVQRSEIQILLYKMKDSERPTDPAELIGFAMAQGVKFTSELTLLFRSVEMMRDLLRYAGSKKTMGAIMKQALMRNPLEAANLLIVSAFKLPCEAVLTTRRPTF